MIESNVLLHFVIILLAAGLGALLSGATRRLIRFSSGAAIGSLVGGGIIGAVVAAVLLHMPLDDRSPQLLLHILARVELICFIPAAFGACYGWLHRHWEAQRAGRYGPQGFSLNRKASKFFVLFLATFTGSL